MPTYRPHKIIKGSNTHTAKINISETKIMNKIDEKIKIKNPFITIPMIIENPTKPSLYSFFNCLKKFLNSKP